MDKETLLRLATPASIFALALSIATLPMTVGAAGDTPIRNYAGQPLKIECVKGCD